MASSLNTQQAPFSQFIRITTDLAEKLKNSPHNTIVPMYTQYTSSTTSKTFDCNGHWKWRDVSYVRLPHSPLNRGNDGSKKWDTVVKQLERLKAACERKDIKPDMGKVMNAVIRAYRKDSKKLSNFGMLSRSDIQANLIHVIPVIVDLALLLPTLLSEPIPILKRGDNKTIYLSRQLCSSLLANAFFCTFPEPSAQLSMPDYNFFPMFNDTRTERCDVKQEKLKCILNYYQAIQNADEEFLSEIVSFERRCVRNRVGWRSSSKVMCNVEVEPTKKIEDTEGMLQVDFANKIIGGGVLNDGSVMEEIRFCISPELIVSRLFTEELDDDEVVVITGTQIFSKYTGYSTSFQYAGPHPIDLASRLIDNFGRTFTQIVAVDAVNFKRHDTNKQFEAKWIDRELHKCYVAFLHGKIVTPVATGNWGCGAFNGDTELKFMIQWLAASHLDRPKLLFHTVDDQCRKIQEITNVLQSNYATVGQVYKILVDFNRRLVGSAQNTSLFELVSKHIVSGQNVTENSRRFKFGLGSLGFRR